MKRIDPGTLPDVIDAADRSQVELAKRVRAVDPQTREVLKFVQSVNLLDGTVVSFIEDPFQPGKLRMTEWQEKPSGGGSERTYIKRTEKRDFDLIDKKSKRVLRRVRVSQSS